MCLRDDDRKDGNQTDILTENSNQTDILTLSPVNLTDSERNNQLHIAHYFVVF